MNGALIPISNEALLIISIVLPVIAGLICFGIRKRHMARGGWIIAVAIVLGATSLLILSSVSGGIFQWTPAHPWEIVMSVLDFAILFYFLYAGISQKHALVIILSILQIVPLAYFEWPGMFPHGPAEHIFFVDQLSIIMCLVISIIGSLIAIYSIKYMIVHEEHLKLERTRQPVFMWWVVMFLGAMNGLVFANDILWLYFFWEVTTLCCYQLIRHDLTDEAKVNALRALWMCSIGGLAFVIAMFPAVVQTGTLSLQALITSGEASWLVLLPVALLCLAGFTKAAQVPFHDWLLGAMIAPTPVSALLHSSTMVKAGVYLVLRLTPAFQGTYLSPLIAIYGGFVLLSTSIMALTEGHGKRVLAFSTIGNLGLIILCAGINTPLAITAALILLIFHATSKCLLFLCAGVIEQNIWSKDIEDMEGLVKKLPLTTSITLAGMASMFLLPFGMLIGKWATVESCSAVEYGSFFMPLVICLLLMGSAVTTVFWTKWAGRLLAQIPSPGKLKFEKQSPLYMVPLIILILLAIVLSIFIAPLIIPLVSPFVPAVAFTTRGWFLASSIGSFASWPFFIVLALAFFIPFLFVTVREKQMRPAYMCGENLPEYDKPEFRSMGDTIFELKTGGYYFEGWREEKMNKYIIPLAVIILFIFFLVLVPNFLGVVI